MLTLNDREWKEFVFADIFDIQRGTALYKQYMEAGYTPYVSASANNNGISAYTAEANRRGNQISLAYDGSVGSTFYQPHPWFASEKIVSIELKDAHLNQHLALFLCFAISHQKSKYSYSYKWSVGIRMNRGKLLLPATSSGAPDYAFMEQYVREHKEIKKAEYIEYCKQKLVELGDVVDVPKLAEKEWGEFRIGSLCYVKRPSSRSKDDYEEGIVPFVASGSVNNGVLKFCKPKTDEVLDKAGCISVSPVDGSSFYQPYAFLGRGGAGSSVLMLYGDCFNFYTGLFISRMVSQTCSKYNYGHMANKDSIKRDRVILPVTNAGNPDYNYMEQYIKNLMLKKYNAYREYIVSIEQETL